MRAPLLLTLFASLVAGWNLHVMPGAEQLKNKQTGLNFMVVCKVRDFDGAASNVKIEWIRNDKVITRIGSVVTVTKPYSNQLMINRPKVSDSGTYTCRAEIDGETQQSDAHISFVDPPRFVDAKTEQHPEHGTTAKIHCQVEGSDELEVFWQFNGSTLENSNRGYEYDGHNLIIPNFDMKKDDGVYLCNAAEFNSYETLTINVTGYSRPQITVFDTPPTGYEGQSVQMQCQATGKPAPTYQWFKGDSEEEMVSGDKYKVEGGLLVIESLVEEDAGDYRCVATNPLGSTDKTAALAIFRKPRIARMQDVSVEQADFVELTCAYSGDGVLRAKFVFGSQEFEVLPEVEETTTTTVAPAAADSEEAADEDDEPMEEGILETTTGASEETDEEEDEDEQDEEETEEQARWKRFVDDASTRVSVRADGDKLIVSIGKISLDDAGTYKCVVENEAGREERALKLSVNFAPVMKTSLPSVVRSFDGHAAVVECAAESWPHPEWSWFKDGDEIEADGSSVVIYSDAGASKLTLHNDEGKNYGEYTCRASNGIGSAVERTVEVVRVLAPREPSAMSCNEHVYPNYAQCAFIDEEYTKEDTKPTHVTVELVEGDEESEASPVQLTLPFSNPLRVPDLNTNSRYTVRARVSNEAGESEWGPQQTIETTNAWAPEPPTGVRVECDEKCVISWLRPNDHGEEITAWQATITELEAETPRPVVISIAVTNETRYELALKPQTRVEIKLAALNSVGASEPAVVEILTPETLTEWDDDSSSRVWMYVLASLIGMLIVVDVVCCAKSQCGILHCICLNCFGRGGAANDKEKDLEAGRDESNRLLSESAAARSTERLASPVQTSV